MKPENIAKLGALFAAVAAVFAEWEKLGPFLDWLAFNARVLWGVDFFRDGLAAIAFGTVVGLFVPYLLDGVPKWRELPAWRTQFWLRTLTWVTTFGMGVYLNETAADVAMGFAFAFGGPFVTMSLWRLLGRFPAFRPRALEPTIGEAHEQMSRAIDATKANPLPVINPSEPTA